MPYIQTRTNANISKERELLIKEKLGEIISLVGKSENWLMVEFVPECNMYFKGMNESLIAYVDVRLYGRSDAGNYNEMTKAISELLNQELEIDKDNIYVSYLEYDNWGWNGNNF